MKLFHKIALGVSVVVFSPAAALSESIVLGADEWCPYNCELGEHQGYVVDIAVAALKKGGVDVKYQQIPWTRAVDDARAGNIDGVIDANYRDAPDFIFPETLQGICINHLWVPSDSKFQYNGIKSLENIKVAAIADYTYGTTFDDYVAANASNPARIHLATGNEAMEKNIKMMLAGRVDAMFEDINAINYYYKQHPEMKGKLKSAALRPEQDRKDCYLFAAFSPKKPESKRYAELLDKGVMEMRKSGEFKKILDFYGIEDWTPVSNKRD